MAARTKAKTETETGARARSLEAASLAELEAAWSVTERRLNLAARELREGGVSREEVLERIGLLEAAVVGGSADQDELRRALALGKSDIALRAFREAVAEGAARGAAGEVLDGLRAWAAGAALDPNIANTPFGAIRFDTKADRMGHLAAMEAERDRQRARLERINELIGQRRVEEREREFADRAAQVRRAAAHERH